MEEIEIVVLNKHTHAVSIFHISLWRLRTWSMNVEVFIKISTHNDNAQTAPAATENKYYSLYI